MSRAILVPCAIVLLWGARVSADPPPVTPEDVLAMLSRIPGRVNDDRSDAYRWETKRGAPAVARAIAASAPSRLWAARMAVYAVGESGLRTSPCVTGDGGKSLGVWQLSDVGEAVACDPARAAPAWLAKAQKSFADCAALPEGERLAELASGACDRGRRLARHREVLALGALGPGGVD